MQFRIYQIYKNGTTIEELEPNDIILFKNNNIVSTNYQNVDIELIYPTYDDFNKYYMNWC